MSAKLKVKKEKAYIIEIAVPPPLREQGYEMVNSNYSYYDFRHRGHNAQILMYRSRYGDYFRIEYGVKPFHLRLDDFIGLHLTSDMYYDTEEEFVKNLKISVDATIRYALPMLDRFSKFSPMFQDDTLPIMDSKTAECTVEKAEIFAKRLGISLEYNDKNIETVENFLDALRGNNYEPQHFLDHIDDIVSVGAYVGEALIATYSDVHWAKEDDDVTGLALGRDGWSSVYTWYPSYQLLRHWAYTPETSRTLKDSILRPFLYHANKSRTE